MPPTEFPHRGFLDRKLAEAGAIFDTLAGAAVALEYGDRKAELEAARRLGLADLSVLPRTGFKGARDAARLSPAPARQPRLVPGERRRGAVHVRQALRRRSQARQVR